MISRRTRSRRWACRAMTYSGPIAATMGSIFVERKKTRRSRQRLTGYTDKAYAAGTASTSTRIVEPRVANGEWVRNGPIFAKAELNSDSVGLKANRGGHVSAAASGLKAVIIIHSTGRKNAIATTHPRTVQPMSPGHRRVLRW